MAGSVHEHSVISLLLFVRILQRFMERKPQET